MSEGLQFPIVGIGASAGGVQALKAFFERVPANPGMAFVVVTHLSPDRESFLHEVIARYTLLPVAVTEQDMTVRKDHVYVMPSNTILTIKGGKLQVRKPDEAKRERKPIDIFFASLALDRAEHCAAVILSGGDGDGTLGAKAIREAGGFALAQATDGSGPQYPEMPRTAIISGVADLAVPAEEMAGRLIGFAHGLKTSDGLAHPSEGLEESKLERAHQEICTILARQSSHDFSGYKTKTFFRRVHRRMQVRQVRSLRKYIDLLEREPAEVTNLFRDLLINVTNFFRDEDAFKILEGRVIPKLFEGKGAKDTLRVWVPGCATGEEVYSIAILLREQLNQVSAPPKVQIFATDIDEQALGVARAGRYPEALLTDVSPERLRRFFKTDGGSYVVTNDIRELCVFSPHSLIRDPPFSRMDLVSCRNLLIYFGAEIQRQVIPTFHYSLKPGGYLFLGNSESIGPHSELFNTIDKKQRIFQAREHPSRVPRLPGFSRNDRSAMFPDGSAITQRNSGQTLRNTVEARILERHSPAHIVVNADGEIVYYSGGTGRFLETPQGLPSRQLLTLARKGLRLELRAALRECVTQQSLVRREGLATEREDAQILLVDFTIEPMEERDGNDPLYLVVFHARTQAPSSESNSMVLGQNESTRELERELRDTREKLQSTIEEYETALEELKSSNEELVSVNEEVQSSNEELEASKEETQSLNEELTTINAELNSKVEELDHANSDLRNLFESTQIATIFLDRQLVIRTFTPAAASFFNLRTTDVGRPLTDLSSQIDYPHLKDDIKSVFESGQSRDHQLARDNKQKHHLVRLIPYKIGGDAIDGVVVTLLDVTQLAEAEQHQKVLISELNHRVKNLLVVIASIAKRNLETASGLEVFGKAFLDRLKSMGKAYAMLSSHNWRSASVRDVFTNELEPFGDQNFDLRGPDIQLAPQPCVSLAMVAHELATNAFKYGSLSAEGGRVDVSWTLEDRMLEISWIETGGPPVTKPGSAGYGSELLHGEIEYRLRGKIETNYRREGLELHLRFPT
ncbi:chemotaxis protein CheR [Rhizobium sp. R72]|uniref:CheR family methyltransferase n=1 Tax=unclassified Rhizobium TaxID=2613769 RepID=UPI000B52D9B1|nr:MULTISPECIES: CheR family methyltransferase [unclassified Rhizobium]OWW00152.1 chemotaxis protein CheR [Rhizobium sp. R72]OWW00543.1 chemotaxis protein CheR [Rhizobium sp. R711]